MSLSVIHLSDIHIKGSNDVILGRIDALKSACISSLPSSGDVVIAVSGDIAFSGQKQQYEIAEKIIDTISKYIEEQKSSKVQVVCVPGNHDCDFSLESSTVRKTLIDHVCLSAINAEYYNNVSAVQDNYRNFAKNYGIDSSSILPRIEISSDENKILFLLANTAWMSIINENPGKIVVPSHLFEKISPEDYKVVFYVLHHPLNWLEPDSKKHFVDHIRQNADIVLVGHEHSRDSYEKIGETFSVYCSHGKELQNDSSADSAFTVINFDKAFQNYDVIDFKWDGHKYDRCIESKTNQYHKNIASKNTVVIPNDKAIAKAKDIGIVINHFAKENVSLPDLFVWPDLSRCDYCNEKNGLSIIRTDHTNVVEELYNNKLNILVGSSCSGKSTIAKMLFLLEENLSSCCLLLRGNDFTSANEAGVQETIEEKYSLQYSQDCLEDFRQLPKEERTVIVDDFDLIKNVKGRRNMVLDYLCGFFGRVTIMLSSYIEIATLLTSNAFGGHEQIIYYEILPFGNRKRKEMITKWYKLNENPLSEKEINDRIDNTIEKINVFLGNGTAFVPAMPVFILSVLQNMDAVHQTYAGSKYGFLYESLIISSFSKISADYMSAGNYNIDTGILSKLSFDLLVDKKTNFTEDQIATTLSNIEKKHLIRLSTSDFLKRMIDAKIIHKNNGSGEVYRFMYPYIFYFFCGKYIAEHLNEKRVQNILEYMSARLYNEIYGNIIIFVCHFANKSEVIDDVLLNAYGTLENYETFDFTKSNPVFEDINDAVEALIPKSIAASDAEVIKNKENRLTEMDDVGLNDGQVIDNADVIDDEVTEKEKDMADVVAAFKTIEVLGQILQNYPVGIDAQNKLDIIEEIHKLGMRSVQAMINTMGYLEKDLVEYVYEHVSKDRKHVQKSEVTRATRRFINLLVSGMARGMIHQVAISLNSEHLLLAATKSFESDKSISSKLVLLDLKLNCLKKCNYEEIQRLRNDFDKHDEKFASRILDSIVGYYLNYNMCDHTLRSRLCSLCGLSQRDNFISQQRNMLN